LGRPFTLDAIELVSADLARPGVLGHGEECGERRGFLQHPANRVVELGTRIEF
jgi:hypothetical protein